MSSTASVSSSIIESAREIRNRRLARRKNNGDNPFPRRRSQSYGSAQDGSSAPRSPVARAVNRIQTNVGSPKYRRPPMVSPNMPLSPCKSFEDERQPRLLPRRYPGSDRSVMSDLGFQPYGVPSDRSFDSESDAMEDMDAELRSLNSQNRAVDAASPRRGMSRPPVVPMGIDFAAGRRSPYLASNDDDVSSLGGVEDQVPGLQRITAAVRNQSSRPPNLSADEKALWDAVQLALRSKRIPEDASDHDDDDILGKEYYQAKYKQAEEQLISQEQEQDRSLRAIQRVLADVTTERDKAVAELKERPKKETKSWQDEKSVMQKDLDTKLSRISSLERQLKLARVSKARLRNAAYSNNSGSGGEDEAKLLKELEELKEQVQTVHEEKQDLVTQLQAKDEQITILMRNQEMAGSLAAESEAEALQKALDEKTTALENAKMIIASLESASGSLATDMREKLKAKQEELATAKAESAQKQKRLDTLAKDLRDLQRKQAQKESKRQEKQGTERDRRIALAGRLERNMADIRAASVILEATHDDTTAINEISDVLGESINALKATIDVIDDTDQSEGDDADNRSSFSQASDREVRTKLEEKSSLVKKLEDDLRKQKDEALQIRLENEKNQQRRDEEMQALHTDIQTLREQCTTNMEVLMKKERELAVLRDSLKVEDDDVGYISDDASDSDEEDDRQLCAVDTTMTSSVYGPMQAEALATLLVHGAPGIEVSSGSFSEYETLKRQLVQAKTDHDKALKQLKTEKESLANAKMIISSLEKANKSMMEDLRSRLQDSNTAIASLLEKSMESEKNTTSLRKELEELRKQKDELEAKLGPQGSAYYRDDIDGFPTGAIVAYDEKKEEITETID